MAFTLDNNKVDNLLLSPGSQGSLTSRAARPVGNKKKKQKPAGPSGMLSAQDLIALFQSMPVPNRGYKNPNASKPHVMGQGMAWMDQNNSPEQVAGRLAQQNTEDWKRINHGYNQGAAAVDFVKQTKGYTDTNGKFIPPTLPSTPSSAYGSGSVTFTDKPTRGTMTDPLTGKRVFMDEYLPRQSKVQDSKFGAMPGRENGGALARPKAPASPPPTPQSDMNAMFPGNGEMRQPPAPSQDFGMPSWVQDALVTPNGGRPATPQGVETYETGQIPAFQSAGMALPPLPNDTPNAWGVQSRAQSFPAGQMTSYTPPNSSPEQLGALNTLHQLFGNQGPASAGLESTWNNMFKGKKDWEYLAQLFPGIVQPGRGNAQNMKPLQKMYQDPVYQSRF